MMKPIDLGMSHGGPTLAMAVETEEPEKYYPSFHYEGKESLDLPEEGVMVIKFRKPSSSVSEHRGEKRYSCTVEVRKILSVKTDEDETPTRKYNGAEDALDKLMKEKMSGDEGDY